MAFDQEDQEMPDDPVAEQLDKWVEFAQRQKEAWLEITDSGDMPPLVIVERAKKPVLGMFAPQVDKLAGLAAVAYCRKSLNIDAAVIVMDARTVDPRRVAEDPSLLEKYGKPGAMAKAREREGAYADIVDCLDCNRIDRSLTIEKVMLGYEYRGKSAGQPLRWLDDLVIRLSERNSTSRVEGLVADNLREIMQEPSLLDKLPEQMPPEERRMLHKAAEALARLKLLAEDYLVFEIVERQNSESAASLQARISQKLRKLHPLLARIAAVLDKSYGGEDASEDS